MTSVIQDTRFLRAARTGSSGTRRRLRCVTALALCLRAAAAMAWDAAVDEAALDPHGSPSGNGLSLQQRAWAAQAHQLSGSQPGLPRVQLSLEREPLQRTQPWTDGAWMHHTTGLSLSVVVATGWRTQLGWQSPALLATQDTSWHRTALQPPGAMVLRASDPLADLRMGALMKLSLGDQTALALRPRKGGGLRLMLNKQW